MLAKAVTENELAGFITEAISTDAARTYKPDPRAYELGVERLGLPREQILFVAFTGWDAAGAKWFGYPCKGAIACEVISPWLDEKGVSLSKIDTDQPWSIESKDGVSEFIVRSEMLRPYE